MMDGTLQQKAYIIYALEKLGALTPAQIGRYLFENEVCEQFDLRSVLTELKEENRIKQAVSINGITYEPADGELAEYEVVLDEEQQRKMDVVGDDLKKKFQMEKDYLARYSEQASGIIPVFLSLREKEKILFKVNVIVRDIETAEIIAKKWPENAWKTYRTLWDCIGEGQTFPDFKGIWGEEDDEKA